MTRTFTRQAGCMVLAACLASLVPSQARQSHDHHAEHAVKEIELDHGRRWATDAPLRAGMERIRAAVATATAQGLDDAKAQALVAAVEDGIAFMVRNCRLKPEADANLHVLLGRLAAAATAVKANPRAPDGLPSMREAIGAYPRYFDHPGWQAIGHAH
ncbi:MAG TPA: hypothetical protein VGE60_03255 [Telluria sp.]